MSLVVNHIARFQITVSNAIKTMADGITLTSDQTRRFRYADVQCLTDSIRYTEDGSTAPVAATTGKVWYATGIKRAWGVNNFLNLKFIRESSDATLVVDIWGE